jgi:hypothetical protein
MSINKRLKARIKPYFKQLVLGGMVLLTSSFSFGLGYLANRELARIPIVIEQCSRGE